MGPRNHVLNGRSDPRGKGAILGVVHPTKTLGAFAVVYAKTAEPVRMPFEDTNLFRPKEACIR